MNNSPERLDSWKSIAEYLGRDVATVRRWEKSAGLPVRRVAGSRGSSVYAYQSEIDEWLKRKDGAEPPAEPERPANDDRRRWSWKVAFATVVAGLAAIAWHGRGPSATGGQVSVEPTPKGIVARAPGGAELWRHAFPNDERAVLTAGADNRAMLLDGGARGVVTGISYRMDATTETVRSGGELLWLTSAGRLERTFSIGDGLAFNGVAYGAPWVMTDFRLSHAAGPMRLAVAAHHLRWWPAIVTILNDRWERTATFVNTGWVERLHWVAHNRLLAVGYSNAREGGMAALLDPDTMEGQSPRADGQYACDACGGESALRYVVMPRSELNRVTASPFNRGVLELPGDRLVITTVEVPREVEPPIAIYEFTPSLEIVSASYGDRYWEMHRALEAQGALDHPRERCADRDGPPSIDVWTRDAGWTTVSLRK